MELEPLEGGKDTASTQKEKTAAGTPAIATTDPTIEDLKVTIHLCKEVKAFQNFNAFQTLVEAVTDMSRQCEGWIKSVSKQNKGGGN